MEWQQGQHVCVVGSNGTGKTFLISKLLEMRDYCIVMRTKADDIQFDGFRTIRSIDAIKLPTQHKYLLAPKYEEQRLQLHRAFEMVWRQRGWCVTVDELFYLCEQLKLERDVTRMLTQGRSLKISMVCGMQRPSRVTRFALSESIHVFVFRAEGRDIKILTEATTPRLAEPLTNLERYQFAYYNRLTNEIKVGRAQDLYAL